MSTEKCLGSFRNGLGDTQVVEQQEIQLTADLVCFIIILMLSLNWLVLYASPQVAYFPWTYHPCSVFAWASLLAQSVKHLPAVQETWLQSLGQEDPLQKEMAAHSSILAWKIPWTEEPGGLKSVGSQNWAQLSN